MKKLFVLLLSVFVVMNVFATTGTVAGDVSATLNLTLNNQYKVAFIEAANGGAPDIVTGPVTPLSNFTLHTTGDALDMSEKNKLILDANQNVFYFYYQAYTNVDNLKIKISAPDDLKNEGSSETIRFKASFKTVTDKWDGEAFPDSITSGSDTSFAEANIKKGSTTTDGDDFNYMGLCKVTITSDVDLGKKKPGNYSANIKLTLTTK